MKSAWPKLTAQPRSNPSESRTNPHDAGSLWIFLKSTIIAGCELAQAILVDMHRSAWTTQMEVTRTARPRVRIVGLSSRLREVGK